MKTTIYHLFFAFRGIFYTITNIIKGFFLLCAVSGIVMGFVLNWSKWWLIPMFLVYFFVVYFLQHLYDKVIFVCKPDDIEITLFK